MEQTTIGQILGFLSFFLGVCTFYQKDDKKLKILMLVFHLNHLLHFFLLGSLVSVVSSVISALRTATAIYISSKRVAAIFVAISLVSGFYVIESVQDIWPILGTVIGTYSVFVLKGIAMRIGFLIGALCWLTNNFIIGSFGGTLLEMTLISVNLMTTVRLIRDQKQVKRIDNEEKEDTCLYTTKTSN
ncbi:YgjV family protein [Vibrio alginolyticus]|uniref:YgjV family protein n=1 Tax=Vibrio alginolyticus TaxID=663 RepID=UPI003F66E34A